MLDTLKRLFRLPEVPGGDQTDQVAAQLYTLTVILLFSACVSVGGYMLVLERFSLPTLVGFSVIPVLVVTLVLLRARRVRPASLTLVVGLWLVLGITAALNGGIESPAYHGLIVVTLCAGLLLGRRAALICTVASALAGLGFVYAEILGALPPYVEVGGQVGEWSTYAIYLLATGVLFNLTIGSVNGSLAEARRQVAERNQAVAQLREREAELRQALDTAQAAEAALGASEGQLRTLIAAIPDQIFIITRAGLFQDVYARDADALFAPAEAIRGRTAHELLPQDVADSCVRIVGRTIARGEVQELEYELGTLGGLRWFQARVAALPGGAEERVIWLARDVSERKRFDVQLREREEIYRRAITAAEAVPYLRDHATGQYVFVGAGIEAITGYTAEEFTPQLLGALEQANQMRHPYAHLTVAQAYALARSGVLREWRCDSLIRTRSGELRWLADSAIEVFDDDGRGVGSVGILQDITERRRTEQALQESEERFRLLSEAGFEGIGVVEDGRVLDANTRLAEMVGREMGELLGRPLADLLEPEGREDVLRRLGEGTPTAVAATVRRADGATFPAELQSRQMPASDRSMLVVAVRDMSERVRLEEQLRRAQKLQAVGQLSGGIAHDFNNLLTVIISYVSMMIEQAEEDSLPDRVRRDLDQILHAGHRAAALTRQLLAISRRQVLDAQPLSINALITGIVPLIERLVGASVELRTALAPDLGQVRADAGQIEQVLFNLAANARDAMPRGGRLTIETRLGEPRGDRPPELLLTVSDTGVGMDASTRARVFEPFFTTKEQGTGLGLAMTQGIVRQNGGQIWFESEPGAGTTFFVSLPLIEGAADSAPERRTAAAGRGSETVLLVEDDAAVRRLARNVLERYGYHVLEATGEDALGISAAYPGRIDLLLTDVVMPGIDGGELAQRLTASRPGLPVIYMSGYTDSIVVHHGVRAGSSAFIQKPFTPSALIGKVRATLDERRRG